MTHATFAPAMANARALIDGFADMLRDHDEALLDDPSDRVEEIEHEPREGFWPWTSGGFEICAPAALSHHWGNGTAPAPLQPLLDSGDEIIAAEWKRQHPDRPGLLECINAEEGTPAALWSGEAEKWESEAQQADTDCYFWKARVMFEDVDDVNEGQPSVYIDVYLNTDLNYGRDHIPWLACYGSKTDQTTGSFKVTFPLVKFARLKPANIAALVSAAARTLP